VLGVWNSAWRQIRNITSCEMTTICELKSEMGISDATVLCLQLAACMQILICAVSHTSLIFWLCFIIADLGFLAPPSRQTDSGQGAPLYALTGMLRLQCFLQFFFCWMCILCQDTYTHSLLSNGSAQYFWSHNHPTHMDCRHPVTLPTHYVWNVCKLTATNIQWCGTLRLYLMSMWDRIYI
jgi:hypothetical protein